MQRLTDRLPALPRSLMFSEALEWAERGLEFAETGGHVYARGYMYTQRAFVLNIKGDFAESGRVGRTGRPTVRSGQLAHLASYLVRCPRRGTRTIGAACRGPHADRQKRHGVAGAGETTL